MGFVCRRQCHNVITVKFVYLASAARQITINPDARKNNIALRAGGHLHLFRLAKHAQNFVVESVIQPVKL